MSVLDWLRRHIQGNSPDADDGRTATVRRIVAELDALEPERARYVAAFAYLLGRVAFADRDISTSETQRMEQMLQAWGDLPAEQAVLVVAIASHQNQLFGGTENFLVAREFADMSTRAQRHELLHCLFAVAAADDSISGQEEHEIRKIATQLGFDDPAFIEIRSEYNHKRRVVQMLRNREPKEG